MATETRDQQAIINGNTFVWHEVYTPNEEAAINFYTTCLDFGTHQMDMGDGFTYKMLTRQGSPVCGVFGTDKPDMGHVPPHWATYISVDDVDKRIELCKEHGATLVMGPMDVPTVGRMALLADPHGAHFWIFTPAS